MARSGVSIKRSLLLAVFSAALLALVVEFEHLYTSVLLVHVKVGDMFARWPVEDDNDRLLILQSAKNNSLPLWWTNTSVLSRQDIDGVEKFVFFIGYPKSGHSIIGSMMDAHPNMIISHEFMLFRKITEDPFIAKALQNKTVLFNVLHQKSCKDAEVGWHSSQRKSMKGYTLEVDSPWQGKFDKSLKVIGDKSGGQTVLAYERSKTQFHTALHQLLNTVRIPIRVIHVVRNPYDMIATSALYSAWDISTSKRLHTLYAEGEINETSLKEDHRYRKKIFNHLQHHSSFYLRLARSIEDMIHRLQLHVLEIHSEDFVKDPRETISRICAFLDLPCPEDYLQACYDKAYKTSTKRRHLVEWPKDVQADVDAALRSIPFFRQYSFKGD